MSAKDDGGPAFPAEIPNGHVRFDEEIGTNMRCYDKFSGMALRDYFATAISVEEITQLVYYSLSKDAQEKLLGRPHPLEPSHGLGIDKQIEYQLKKFQFLLDINAHIRFMHADAMLEARKS